MRHTRSGDRAVAMEHVALTASAVVALAPRGAAVVPGNPVVGGARHGLPGAVPADVLVCALDSDAVSVWPIALLSTANIELSAHGDHAVIRQTSIDYMVGRWPPRT